MSEKQLELKGISVDFEGIRALDCVSLSVNRGEVFALVGPNGAGKSTVLNVINGIYKPTAGTFYLEGEDITGLSSHRIASLGIARTFQLMELFRQGTVLDNLLVGCHHQMKGNLFTDGVFWGLGQKEEILFRRRAEEVMDFLEIGRYRKSPVAGLPYGIQKLVSIGRALCLEPKVLLLDEPGTGMTRQEKEDLARFLIRMKAQLGLTIVWIEHDVGIVADLADSVAVLHYGVKIAEGQPAEVISDPAVLEAFVGKVSSK